MSIRKVVLASVILGGCGVNPTGTWAGDFSLIAEDGSTFTNELDVQKDNTESATMYFTAYDEELDQDLIYYLELDGTWDIVDGQAQFDMSCSLADCDFDLTLTCDKEGDMLLCTSSPEFYTDRDPNWVKVD